MMRRPSCRTFDPRLEALKKMASYWRRIFAIAWRETAAAARLDSNVRRWLTLGTPLAVLGVGWLATQTLLLAAAIALGFIVTVVAATFLWKFGLTPPRLAALSDESIRALEAKVGAFNRSQVDEAIAHARDIYFARQSQRFIGFAPTIIRQPQFTLIIAPVSMTSAPRIDVRKIDRALSYFSPPDYTEAEQGNDENEWWKHDPKVVPEPLKNGVSRWSTRLFNNGVFEHVQVLPGSISPDGPGAIDGHALEHAIVSMADRLSRAYGELGFGDSALIGVTLYGVTEITLSDGAPGPRPFQKPNVTLDPILTRRIGDNVGDDLLPLFDTLWRAAGWKTGAPTFVDGSWQGYRQNALSD